MVRARLLTLPYHEQSADLRKYNRFKAPRLCWSSDKFSVGRSSCNDARKETFGNRP
jgi:hypothetical protein